MQPQAGSPVQLTPPKGMALIKGRNIKAVLTSGVAKRTQLCSGGDPRSGQRGKKQQRYPSLLQEMQGDHGSIARVKIVVLWAHLVHVYIQVLKQP